MKFTSSFTVAASVLAVAQAVAVPKEAGKTVTVTKYAETSTTVITKTYTAPGTCSVSKSTSKSTSHSTSHSTSNSVFKSSSTSVVTIAPTTVSSTSSTSSAVSYPSTTYPTKPAYPICTSTSKFAKVSTSNPRLFDFNGTGKAEYFAGTNIWFASHILSDSDLDIMFSRVKESQLQVVRVWGFGSVNTDPGPGTVFFQTLNSTGAYINYAANGMPRLDAVVSTAEKYGLKLVFPFVNNWSDLGGIASYNAAFGGNATTWYTDAQSQKVYKEWVKLLVQRYKCSPAIFAWELGNEPRCKGCDSSVIYNWATEISQFIKSLDSKHMVTLGDEGWLAPADNIGDGSYAYSGIEGIDFVKNLGIKTLDYGTFHLYPESWGYNYTWGSEWILQHDAVGAAANKPVVFEEYGVPFPHNHTSLVQPWQQTTLASGVAMDQFWQWATNGLSTGDSGYDVNSIWYNDTEYQVLVRDHAAAMLDKLV